MHFEVDTSAGTIKHPTVTVPLHRDNHGEPVPGTGLRIQPISIFLVQEIMKEIDECTRRKIKAWAAEIGKEARDLTPMEMRRANLLATTDAEILDRVSRLLVERIAGWDDELIGENGRPLGPEDKVGDRTVKEVLVESIMESTPDRAIVLLLEVANAGARIEGNSSRRSAGNGDSGASPGAGKEASTASASTSPDEPTAREIDADSSEVAVAPV